MRNISLCCAVFLCLVGCNKVDDVTAKEVIAKFSFVVKEMNFSDDPPEYELKDGDEIEINVKGYDVKKYADQTFKMGGPTPEFESKSNLVFNGSEWDLVKDGAIVQRLEFKGDERTFVIIECFFTNPENGHKRYAKREIYFNECQGDQTIDLVFYNYGN